MDMMTGWYILIGYAVLVNTVSFCVTGWDKYKARREMWRTPERAMILLSLFGGGIGVLAAFYLFRHKIRDIPLQFSVWLITVAYAALAVWLLFF